VGRWPRITNLPGGCDGLAATWPLASDSNLLAASSHLRHYRDLPARVRCVVGQLRLLANEPLEEAARSSPAVTVAVAGNVSLPTSMVTAGLAMRLWNQAG
jgi:hypothetical protein